MAHEKDYVPGGDAAFDGWLDNLTQYVGGRTGGTKPIWSFIPQDRASELQNNFNDWHSAYAKLLGPHTAVDTEEKIEQRKRAEKTTRAFVQQFLKFDPVTNEDRTAMNLPIHDGTKMPIAVPATRVIIGGLKDAGGFRVEIPFHDETKPNSRAIPYGDNGSLLYYAVGTEKITDYNLLARTKLMTHSPFVLQLEPEAEGKIFSGACRWQNERGEVGPWSEIHHIVVS